MDLDLNPDAIPDQPLAIGFSGGGDSTALVFALRARSPLVFIVDHGLRSGSANEALAAQAFARSLGLHANILTWSPPPMASGLQAKARQARYALLGQACRERGVKTLLTGHTEDDQAETVLMRLKSGGNWRGAAGMSAVTPSPLWPELADINLNRPMLGLSRAHIRRYLSHHSLPYVDDPSNENRGYARIRARDELLLNPKLRHDMLTLSGDMQQAREQENLRLQSFFKAHVSGDAFGNIHLSHLPSARMLAYLICAASGRDHRPREEALIRLRRMMHADGFNGATLGGASIVSETDGWRISRDPVAAVGRHNVTAIPKLDFAERTLWDGRFWLNGKGSVSPAGQRWIEAPPPLKEALKSCPASSRAVLPLWEQGGQIVAIGPFGVDGQYHNQVKSVVLTRLDRELSAR